MKNKINLRKTLITTLAVASITFSCKDSFLEVLPTGSLGEAQLTSKAGVEGSLLGAYSMMLGKNFSRLAGPNNWVFGSIMGGDANKGTDPGDFTSINPIQRYEADATNGEITSTWLAKYEGISRTNSTIRLANKSKVLSADDKKRIIGEARFIRGHFYFELKKLFNSAPYIDETLDYELVLRKYQTLLISGVRLKQILNLRMITCLKHQMLREELTNGLRLLIWVKHIFFKRNLPKQKQYLIW